MFASDNCITNYRIDTRNYNVGMYLRLSRADDKEEEFDPSESIKNQREFVTRYILDNGWNLYDEYVDDGYTGTNFNRPDFQRMIQDIENGYINLIIVKDLSRFGRNYVRTGMYIDEYFPLKDVRFIAINDGIDTFKKNNSNNELCGFKGIMNDMYSADISKKIRTSFNTKRQNGQFIGAFAPYGYQKDPNNKNKLIIDPEASLVVKRIFNMRLSGIGNEAIMRTLNNEDVPCPTKYKQLKGSTYKNANIVHFVWRAETIKDILRNPVYIGHMAQRRCERISYKVRKHKKIPRKNWIVVENTHEPIIDKETYNTVQELLNQKAYGKTEKKTEHLLSGLLVCGDCGLNITYRRQKRKGKKEFITLCSNYSRFHKCTRHSVLEDDIIKLILNDLKSISKKVIKDKNKFLQKIHKPTLEIDNNNNNIRKTINKKEARIKEIINLRKSLYEDWKKEFISQDDFNSMNQEYNKEKEQLNKEIENLQNSLDNSSQKIVDTDLYELLKQIINFDSVPKQILINLIDKIEIFQDKTIKIHYKFPSP